MVCVWGVGQPNLAPYKNPAPDLGSIARAGDTQAVLRFGEFIVIYSSPIVAVSTLGCEGVATWGGGGLNSRGGQAPLDDKKHEPLTLKAQFRLFPSATLHSIKAHVKRNKRCCVSTTFLRTIHHRSKTHPRITVRSLTNKKITLTQKSVTNHTTGIPHPAIQQNVYLSIT